MYVNDHIDIYFSVETSLIWRTSLHLALSIACSFWRTLVVDPSSTAYYRWLGVISAAVLYNLLVIIARSVFWQLRDRGLVVWFLLDYTCDIVYLVDMFVQLRTGLSAQHVYDTVSYGYDGLTCAKNCCSQVSSTAQNQKQNPEVSEKNENKNAYIQKKR